MELHHRTKDKHHIIDMLKSFATQSPTSITYKTQSQFIRGFFRSNHERLEVRISNHTIDYTPPPSEDRLAFIYENATLEQKCLMSLQADTGERIGAISLTSISDMPDLDPRQDLHVIHFDKSRTKNHKEHVSYYSEPTAQLIRDVLSKHNITHSRLPIFPNGRHVWKRITAYSKEIGTRFRSHHLRKRFQHIAERTPMPIPSINYLMGETKKELHCAEVYSYTVEDELAQEYQKHLLTLLPIRSPTLTHTNQQETTSVTDALLTANQTIQKLLGVMDALRAG